MKKNPRPGINLDKARPKQHANERIGRKRTKRKTQRTIKY